MVPPQQESACCANPTTSTMNDVTTSLLSLRKSTTKTATTTASSSTGYIDTPLDSTGSGGSGSGGGGMIDENNNNLLHHHVVSSDSSCISLSNDDNEDDDDEYLLEMEGHAGNGSTNFLTQHLNQRDEASSTPTDDRLRQDMRHIANMRAIMMLTVLTFVFVAGQVVCIRILNHERSRFRKDYSEVADRIIHAFEEGVHKMKLVAQTLSNNIEQEYDVGTVWPFVTISNFQKRCEGPMILSGAKSMNFIPIVPSYQLLDWFHYTSGGDSNQMYDYTNDLWNMVGNDDSKNKSIYEQKDDITAIFQNSNLADYFPVQQSTLDDVYKPNISSILYPESWSYHALQLMKNLSGPVVTNLNLLQERSQSTSNRTVSDDQSDSPRTYLYYPIKVMKTTSHLNTSIARSWSIQNTTKETVVGAIGVEFLWEDVLSHEFEDVHLDPIIIVLEGQCGNRSNHQENNTVVKEKNLYYSYHSIGSEVKFMSVDETKPKLVPALNFVYNTTYENYLSILNENHMNVLEWNKTDAMCAIKISVYPTMEYQKIFLTNRPTIYQFVVIFVLSVLLFAFFIFDCCVSEKQRHLLEVAKQSDAIVRSLFPGKIADRLYQHETETRNHRQRKRKMFRTRRQDIDNENLGSSFIENKKAQLRNFVGKPMDEMDMQHSNEPLADIYPNATVIFADIAGFTSWSSERDPSQVFTLLESIYSGMDLIANKFKVFKVETIGDCYVGAAGVPDVQDDHAVLICKFARFCIVRTNKQFNSLVATLGPGTGELTLRIGIHSGSVTAGVLRGQKYRFQLFGDTINTASRMESTGERGRIQVSEKTAELLSEAGKGSWLSPRKDLVHAKGKGPMQTYWLMVEGTASSSRSSVSCYSTAGRGSIGFAYTGLDLFGILGSKDKLDTSMARLVDWNTEIMFDILKTMSSRRKGSENEKTKQMVDPVLEKQILCSDKSPMNDVRMEIEFPEFDPNVEIFQNQNPSSSNIQFTIGHDKVRQELKSFVSAVASCYTKNPFHNFEHASHVVLAATKIFKRIMAADEHISSSDGKLTTQDLYEHTFGIAWDPLTHFAIVFSCLCHDLDHPGIPNTRVMKESPHLANKYEEKSIAEQHSIDVTFTLLMQPEYENLRRAIYTNEAECRRFRQLCVNLILATDIMDPTMKKMRNERWDLAFQKDDERLSATNDPEEYYKPCDRNRKATIVLEHIIQASDVAHTFQHWAIFTKWNECLFHEMYAAYLDGRSDTDPSINWYESEKGFFDFYIIPLANKLKDCWSVFGLSHAEFLSYATSNRMEWEMKGEEIVANMKAKALERIENNKDEDDNGFSENFI